MSPKLLTISQFCEATNVKTTFAYELINQGKVKATKLGKKTLIKISDLEDFINNLPEYKVGGSDGE